MTPDARADLDEAIEAVNEYYALPQGHINRSLMDTASAAKCRIWVHTYGEELRALDSPVPMVLHCPTCGLQHIDTATEAWSNPPHRSHLCVGCGHIWRPADVETVGIAAISTRGKNDSPVRALNDQRNRYETGLRAAMDYIIAQGLRPYIPEVEACGYAMRADPSPPREA